MTKDTWKSNHHRGLFLRNLVRNNFMEIYMRSMFFVAAVFVLPGAQAWAQTERPVSTDALYECTQITDDLDRLACFDEAVDKLKSAEAAGEIATITAAEISNLNTESFGFSLPSIPNNLIPKFNSNKENDLDSVELPVSAVKRLHYDNLRITLENGQVWEQTDNKQINFNRKRGVEVAQIKRAAFGSFKMKLDDGRSFRVKRIK
jgi:hypothetical protein